MGRQAEERPEGVALVSEGKEMSYVELERASNQAGNYLQKQGVKRGERVGVCVGAGRGVVVWAMGVLKAGGVVVPMEVDEGRERVKWMVKDGGVKVVVTEEKLREGFAGMEGVELVVVDGGGEEEMEEGE